MRVFNWTLAGELEEEEKGYRYFSKKKLNGHLGLLIFAEEFLETNGACFLLTCVVGSQFELRSHIFKPMFYSLPNA
jgi:hypothetical protein